MDSPVSPLSNTISSILGIDELMMILYSDQTFQLIHTNLTDQEDRSSLICRNAESTYLVTIEYAKITAEQVKTDHHYSQLELECQPYLFSPEAKGQMT